MIIPYHIMSYHIISDLLGGLTPPKKYESVGMIIPNIWKKCLDLWDLYAEGVSTAPAAPKRPG